MPQAPASRADERITLVQVTAEEEPDFARRLQAAFGLALADEHG